jgi:hypothetical protein
MKKCEGCWKFLGVCVRYCSRECQFEDYYDGEHKRVCGAYNKSNEAKQAIKTRKDAIYKLGLEDELIQDETGNLGFTRLHDRFE